MQVTGQIWEPCGGVTEGLQVLSKTGLQSRGSQEWTRFCVNSSERDTKKPLDKCRHGEEGGLTERETREDTGLECQHLQ